MGIIVVIVVIQSKDSIVDSYYYWLFAEVVAWLIACWCMKIYY